MNSLDESLAAGRISKMDYLLARMRLVEEEADRIIAANPQGHSARAALAYDQRPDNRPRHPKRYRN